VTAVDITPNAVRYPADAPRNDKETCGSVRSCCLADWESVMSMDSVSLSDGGILARLVTRREVAPIAASALVAVLALLVTSGLGREAAAQSTDGTATADESTIYRPATPVA
jgi:hypothetical protein